MSQKREIVFLLHPNDYKEIPFSEITLANPIDVYILSKLNFKTVQNIKSEDILLNFSSYAKNIILNNNIQKNSSVNEIMNLKNKNIDIFIVSKEYIIKNKIFPINNIPSNIQLIEIQGKKVLYFPNDIRSFIIINMQNAPSLINNQHNTNQNINPNNNISFINSQHGFNSIIDNNNELKRQLKEEKDKNLNLMNENKILKETINKLNDELNQMKVLKEIIEKDLVKKIIEIQNLLLKKNKKDDCFDISSIKSDDKIFGVNFISMGRNDIGHYNLVCKNRDLFVRLEERLYEDFPQFKDYETYFEVNGKRIKRFKTIEQNHIKMNDIVCIFVIE